MRENIRIKNIILKLVGIILFIFILTRIDLRSFSGLLKNIDMYYFIAAALLLFPMLFIRAYRWNYIKRTQKINYRLWDSILMYGSGIYIGLLTPGRIGDFIKVLYLKNDGNSVGKSFVSVFADRISDLLFLIAFGYLGMFFFMDLFKKQVYFLFILFLAVLLIVVFVVANKKLTKKLVRKLFWFFVPSKYKEKVKVSFNDFYINLKILNRMSILKIFIMTVFAWAIYFVQVFFLAKALGISISFIYLSICACISALIALIPISISGIGTRDMTFIILFSLLAIEKEFAVAVSMLILFTSVLMALIGLACWLKKPVRFSKAI